MFEEAVSRCPSRARAARRGPAVEAVPRRRGGRASLRIARAVDGRRGIAVGGTDLGTSAEFAVGSELTRRNPPCFPVVGLTTALESIPMKHEEDRFNGRNGG